MPDLSVIGWMENRNGTPNLSAAHLWSNGPNVYFDGRGISGDQLRGGFCLTTEYAEQMLINFLRQQGYVVEKATEYMLPATHTEVECEV